MAELIGRTKSWAAWLVGAALALVFGGAGCGRVGPVAKYGAPPRPPAQPPTKPADSKPTAGLEESADWKVITDAWDFCMPFARSGKSSTAQRNEIDEKLAAAAKAGERLAAAGLLSAAEVALLGAELDKAVKDIVRDPPVGVKCYVCMSIPAVQRLSLESIAARLPAIEELVRGGKVQPAAIAKVLEAIEADIETLADDKRRAELGDQTPKAEADKLRDAAKAQVERLRKQLEAGK